MKLRVLAAAIAATSLSVAAQADLSISGDVGVAFIKDGVGAPINFDGYGSEVNFKASEKVGSLTFSGAAEVELQDGGDVAVDDVNVGVSGGFGSVTLGDTGSACDQLLVGGAPEMEFTAHAGGCADNGTDLVVYQRSMAGADFAASIDPDLDFYAVAVAGKLGAGLSAALSWENEDGEDQVTLGLAKAYGPVEFGFRANDSESVSLNGTYTKGNGSTYAAVSDSDGTSLYSLGYTHAIGKTSVFAEAVGGDNEQYAAGVVHSF